MAYYHLRKPNYSKTELVNYIATIPDEFHGNIVLHSYHELVRQFDVKGLHYTESHRLKSEKTLKNEIDQYQHLGKSVSTSFHSLEDLMLSEFNFDYQFLSPVFDSISKKGYHGKGFEVHGINKKVIGMGGVTIDNILMLKDLGYSGLGAIGGVWYTDDPVNSFEQMQNAFE